MLSESIKPCICLFFISLFKVILKSKYGEFKTVLVLNGILLVLPLAKKIIFPFVKELNLIYILVANYYFAKLFENQ